MRHATITLRESRPRDSNIRDIGLQPAILDSFISCDDFQIQKLICRKMYVKYFYVRTFLLDFLFLIVSTAGLSYHCSKHGNYRMIVLATYGKNNRESETGSVYDLRS